MRRVEQLKVISFYYLISALPLFLLQALPDTCRDHAALTFILVVIDDVRLW